MLRRLLSILPLVALSIGVSQGQAFYGSIVGNVNDSSGAALPSASVPALACELRSNARRASLGRGQANRLLHLERWAQET
jgi:hypothetical protein